MSDEPGQSGSRAAEPAENGTPPDEFFEQLRSRDLRGFTGGQAPDAEPSGARHEFNLETKVAAATDLIKILLGVVIRAHPVPAGERVAWEYAFEFNGNSCRLRSTKWGLRLSAWLSDGDQATADTLSAEVQRRLVSAAALLHREIAPLIDREVDANRVTLVNQHARARGMVDYFALLLDHAQPEDPQQIAISNPDDASHDLIEAFGRVMTEAQHRRERGYLAIALLAGYFTYIQHVLVMLSAFSPRALDPEFSVAKLLKAEWAEQFDTAFPPPHEPHINGAKSELSRLGTLHRNPLLHGGGRRAADGMFVSFAPGHSVLATEDGELSDQFMLWQPALSPEQIDDIREQIRRIDEVIEQHPYFSWVRSGLPADFRPEAIRRALQALARGDVDNYIEGADMDFDDQINWDGGWA